MNIDRNHYPYEVHFLRARAEWTELPEPVGINYLYCKEVSYHKNLEIVNRCSLVFCFHIDRRRSSRSNISGRGFKIVFKVTIYEINSSKQYTKMSPSGAVYQPTTVTYEANTSPQERWSDRPISYLTSFTRTSGNPCGLTCAPIHDNIPTLFLGAGAICAAIGLILLINGAIFYSDPQTIGENFYLTCTILGALIFCLGVFLFGMFLRQSRRLCCRTGKDPLDPVTGQALTVNPSTDLLVAAQYAPVSEVAYQPPSEDTEQSKLMPQEHKDEDTDRMIERDPRIVLSPLNPTTHEDT